MYYVLAGDEEGYQNVTLSLMREASVNTTGAQEWWDISIADCRVSCGVLPMVIFNDKVSPPSLGFLAGYGYTACIPFMRYSAGFYCIHCRLN